MGGRALLILLLVAGLLYGLLHFSEQKDESPDSLLVPALGGRQLADATRLVLRGARDMQPYTIERVHGRRFQLVEPIRDMLSMAFLDQLAATFESALLLPAYQKEEVTADLLRQSGLDQSIGLLEATFEDGVVRLEIGLPGPLGGDVFVARDGVIYRGSQSLLSSLQGNPDDMRERLVFEHSVDLLDTITLERLVDRERAPEGRRETLSFVRTGPVWRLDKPIVARADTQAVNQWAATFLGMRVQQFVVGNLNPRPEPDYRLKIQGVLGGETCDFWLQQDNSLMGRHPNRDLDFMLGPADYERLFQIPALQLRSRLLAPGSIEQLVRIKIMKAGRSIRFDRGMANDVRLFEPLESETDPTAVSELLQAVRRVYTVEFVEDPPADAFEGPVLDLELTDQMQPRPVTIRIGRSADADTFYARRMDESYVVKVPAEAVTPLHRPWPAYVSRSILVLAPGIQVQRVAAYRGEARFDTAPEIEFQRGTDGRFRRVGEEETRPLVLELVDALKELRAAAVVDPATLPSLPPPQIVHLMRDSGDVLGEIRVHVVPGEQGEKVYATTPRQSGVLFELRSRDARDLLEALRP